MISSDEARVIMEKLDTMHAELTGEISGLKEDVSGLKGDVSGLKGDVSGLKEDVSGLKGDVSGLKEDVSGLKKDVSGLKEDFNGMQQQINVLKEYTGSLGAYVRSLESRIEFNEKDFLKRLNRQQESMDHIQILLETEIRNNISIVAEGHLDLSRRLKENLAMFQEKENEHVRLNIIESEIRMIKEKMDQPA